MLSRKGKDEGKIGTTLKGVGPAYMDKSARVGIRVAVCSSRMCSLWLEQTCTTKQGSQVHLRKKNEAGPIIESYLKAGEI